MKATEFKNDDRGYLAWIGTHLNGYVLNTKSTPDPSYMVLHRADCHSIGTLTGDAREGGFTERQYLKVCGSVDALSAWTIRNGRPDGSFSKRCKHCKP